MPAKPAAIALLLGCAFFLTGQAAFAAGTKKKSGKSDPASPAVEKVLRSEVVGKTDRREQLAEVLARYPDSQRARWQAGFIKEGSSWRSFESAAPDAIGNREEYLRRREAAPQTYEGQLDLGNWCRKNGLVDQEYAHLNAALEMTPGYGDPRNDDPELLARLGYRQVGGFWLSRESIRDWDRLNQATEAALAKWESKLTSIAEGLTGSARQREIALAALKQIKDPGAIPAIELVLAGRSEDAAQIAVSHMRQIDGPAASLAVAKQAAFSQWAEVRKTATTALKSRTLEEFVPPLLALLATPVKARVLGAGFGVWTLAPLGTGAQDSLKIVLMVSYVLYRETADQFQVATFRSTNYLINAFARGEIVYDPQVLSGDINNLASPRVLAGRDAALRFSALEVDAREGTAAELNERTEDLNRRIGTILTAVTGKEPPGDPMDPRFWWQWWEQFTDSPSLGEKAVVKVGEDESILGNPTFGLRHVSCFGAGTPVWTDQGPVAIEKLAVGDRVLSKDIETGALAYRPVLKATVRPPNPLTVIRLTDEQIACTPGHLFWESGQGWIKARDLASQTLLHTITGNTPVWSIRKGDTGKAYNLVVADFHTYFVGKTGILCQDLLAPKRTNNVVPGLARK